MKKFYTFNFLNKKFNKNIKILAIGDIHIKVTNLHIIPSFIDQTINFITQFNPDCVILLGDILDTHETILTPCLKHAEDLFNKIRDICNLYVIVGNHDMINNQIFLTPNHWMNSFKEWRNVTIVDKVTPIIVHDELFICVPYVFPGRFIEALNTLDHWQDANTIFCHQEFYGVKMGAIVSTEGDKWNDDWPLIVSGHVHERQILQHNIVYTGSAMQHSFGSHDNQSLIMLDYTHDDTVDLYLYDLNLPTKKIISMQFDSSLLTNLKKINKKENQELKITLTGGHSSEFQVFKKSKEYKNLTKQGIKIVHKPECTHFDNEVEHENSDETFETILLDLIMKTDNKEDLLKLYTDFCH